jgi:hypothetical protein
LVALPFFFFEPAIDTTIATDRRSELFGDRLERSVLSTLHDVLLQYNPYVAQFRQAAVFSCDCQQFWPSFYWLFGRFGRLCVAVPSALCSSRAVCQVAHVVPEPAMLSVGVTATSQSARLLRIILQSLCIRVP